MHNKSEMSNRCINLTKDQLKALTEAERVIQKPVLWKRIQSVRMRNAKLNQDTIAEVLGVRPETIRIWLKKYRSGGLRDLLSQHYSGRKPQLGEKEMNTIAQWHKTVKPFQKVEELQQFIAKHFDVQFHPYWVRILAKERLKISFKVKETAYHRKMQNTYASFVRDQC